MAWVDGTGAKPSEFETASLIDRFGAEAVYGRPMRWPEIHRILVAENVEAAYRAYIAALNSDDGASGWAENNPEQAQVAAWAMMLGELP